MAVAVFDPRPFNFDDVDFRRVGNVVSGGTSLSGYDDPIETDGGGFWRLDLTNGEAMDRESGLAWRAITEAMDGGASAVIVLLCHERLFQPIFDAVTDTSNGQADDSKGANYTAAANAALRATTMQIAGVSERPLVGGETLSIEHPTWGWRAYRITEVSGSTVTIRPPLREAITAGTPLEFDQPRCKMRVPPGAAPSSPTNAGRYTACSITFVEDMRKPS